MCDEGTRRINYLSTKNRNLTNIFFKYFNTREPESKFENTQITIKTKE